MISNLRKSICQKVLTSAECLLPFSSNTMQRWRTTRAKRTSRKAKGRRFCFNGSKAKIIILYMIENAKKSLHWLGASATPRQTLKKSQIIKENSRAKIRAKKNNNNNGQTKINAFKVRACWSRSKISRFFSV